MPVRQLRSQEMDPEMATPDEAAIMQLMSELAGAWNRGDAEAYGGPPGRKAMSLENKIAIVTGGGAGIGEALCRELARRGARVVVADINGDDADRVATAIAGDGGEARDLTPAQ